MSTALQKYQRLEASALWRETPDAQRREVIISVGDASLLISDLQDRPLAHWSLAAVVRANPGKTPVIFAPGGNEGETLELDASETAMIEAIETLSRALHRRAPRPGRLRWLILLGSIFALAAGLLWWLPSALQNHVVALVPQLNRVVIGQDVLAQLERTSGRSCHSELGDQAVSKLTEALGVASITIVPDGVKTTASLPGPALIVGRRIVEDHEDPAAAIGFMIAEKAYATQSDPLARILEFGGWRASFRLLTSGMLASDTLALYAEHLAVTETEKPDDGALIDMFAALGIPPSPYAYAIDISGETTLPLIEADAIVSPAPPILTDGEWVALQDICSS